MKKLDIYFVREILKIFALSIGVAEIVLLSLQAIRLASLIVGQGLGFVLVVKMLLGLAVSFLPIVLPISFLFSLLIVFGRMASDREFLALQAMGRAPSRLVMPGLFVGAFIALMTLGVSFVWGPVGNRNFEISIDTAFKKKVTSVLRAGTFSEGFLNMVVFVDQIDPITQELRRVFMFDEKSFTESTAISAKRGNWIQNPVTGQGTLRLYDGLMLVQDHKGDRVQRIRFDEYNLYATISSGVGRSRDSPASQDWSDLVKKREDYKSLPQKDPRSVWMEIARRIAVSFACLLFVPLCFALALDNNRTAKNRAVFSGLVIVLIYWSLYFGLATWFQRAPLPLFRTYESLSWIVIWIPNFIVAIVGTWLFRKRSRLA
ncbi:MAG: LptF/LptG family permease [Bdellovibrionota bacterium]